MPSPSRLPPALGHGEKADGCRRLKELTIIIIILVFAILVFVFYGFFISQVGRDGGEDTMPPRTNIGQSKPVDDLVGPPPPGWTALDDEQLTRLLRESSP